MYYDQKPPPPPFAAPPPGAPSYGYQPPPPYGQYGATGVSMMTQPSTWTTGLCDCLSDVPNCCMTLWCPCITFGRIAEIADRGTSSCGAQGSIYALLCLLTGCGCLLSCAYRSKLRHQYLLPDTPCNDCCVHCCCDACALCQEYRELQNRGFDMSIGWQGNMARQQTQGIVMPPVAPGGMTR